MNYGESIRKAREDLNIFQKELASANLSRNLLSNIEMGRVNLVPVKAMHIYRRILEIAWSKNIYYQIEFDELLSSFDEYILLKESNEICHQLYKILQGNVEFNKTYVLDSIEFAKKNEVGYLRYHIYHLAAKTLENKELNGIRLKVYFSTLDYLKWKKPIEVIGFYDSCLQEVTTLAYSHGEYKSLIHYYETFREFHIRLNKVIDPIIYYNLSLFNQVVKEYDKALDYTNKYLEYNDQLSRADIIDAQIIKAAILTSMENIEEGLCLYDEIIGELLSSDSEYQLSLCLSNSIFVISKYNVESRKGQLLTRISLLNEIISRTDQRLYKRHSLFSNIAQGFECLEDYKKAEINFRESIRCIKLDSNYAKKITVLIEGFNTFKRNDSLDYVIDEVIGIDMEQVSGSIRGDYALFLLKLTKIVCCDDICESKKDAFRLYIEQTIK